MRYASAWILTLAILSIAGGWVSMRIATRTPPLPVLDSLGGDFALPSTIGGISHLSDFRGDLVLLNFGYTSCPDVCVTVLARIPGAKDPFMLPLGTVQPTLQRFS